MNHSFNLFTFKLGMNGYLIKKKHEYKESFSAIEEKELIEWSQTPIDKKILHQCIENDTWRIKM